ncbi:serine O-acetyltransferase EpsC [Novosphingobium terrae]|uniref:serine O-acetyltransferase EpsC n=1 Tax=Novosphingobium terrae TaxID=2726189 RepID=UPI00197D4073|nr:serine O-acetyltransferase EpsC [Novosphingobium terrae]
MTPHPASPFALATEDSPVVNALETGLDGLAQEDGFDLTAITHALRDARKGWRGRLPCEGRAGGLDYGAHGFPSRHALAHVVETLSAALFPMRLGPSDLTVDNEDAFVAASLRTALPLLARQVAMELAYVREGCKPSTDHHDRARRIIAQVAERLPDIRRLLDSDLEAAFAGDPAARSVDEVLLCYPFVTAVIHHRLAHELYLAGATLVARIIAEIAHSRTGIDIHPGATIGESFFIDHGTGVVIGQTAIIGRRVRLYQAVTLGARSFAQDADGHLVKDIARHPIIEDDVTIYAGATILGRVTIGARSVIGGNVWLTKSIPPGSQVRQVKPSVDIETTDPFA